MVVSLKAKATAITSCVIIVVFLVVSIAYYKGLEKYAVERAYSQAIPIMEVGQMMIDGDAFQKVMQSNNRENEEYKEIKKTLDILGHLTEEGQIFTAGIKEGQLVYLGDDIKDYKVLKNLEANDEGIEAVTNNIMQTLKRGEPYYFNKGHKGYRKGCVAGVLLPITSSNHELVGVIAYQTSDAFCSGIRLAKRQIIVSFSMIIIVCILLNYLGFRKMMRPVDNILDAMKSMAKGDFKVQVDTTRKDEIGVIAKELTKSCERISQTVDHINISATNLRFIAEKVLSSSMKSMNAFEEFATSTREISLISYEQVDKREEAKRAVIYLEEDVRIMMTAMDKEQKQCRINEELIRQMASHVATIKEKLYALDCVFEIIDNHTVNLAAVTDKQMASSQEFTELAQSLNLEAESLNRSVSRVTQ